MPATLIIGLDLASHSAACWGRLGETPQCRHWELTGTRAAKGAQFIAVFRSFLSEMRATYPAHRTVVFIEAPLEPAVMVELGTHKSGTILLPGLVFMAESLCHAHEVEPRLVSRQDALLHFTGRARYTRTAKTKRGRGDLFAVLPSRGIPADADPGKQACLARARALRWPVTTLDEADAAALFDFGCAQFSRSRALVDKLVARPSRPS